MWDTTPWFVGGGAQHSPEVARLLAYAATGGTEGIVTPGDLKVVPTDVPSSSVRVLAGAGLILSRAAGGSQQTYVARNVSEDVRTVTATGSGSGRNDLVIARIEDPYMAGEPWADPSDPKVGPYVFTRIVPNVAASVVANHESARAYLAAQGISGIPLAALILPSNTSTITAGMIRDLRKLALPRSSREVFMSAPSPESAMENTSGAVWPDFRPIVTVPTWATAAYVICTLSSVGQRGGAAQGYFTAVLGGGLNGITGFRASNIGYDLDAPAAGGSRHTLVVGGGFTDVRSIAGKDVYVQTEARKINAAENPGYLVTVDGTQVLYDVQFYERAV